MSQQNESPFGNPRFLAALGITFLGLWGWQFYVSSKYPQTKPAAAVEGTTTQQVENPVEKATTDASANPQAKTLVAAVVTSPEQVEKLFSYEDNMVSFSISSKGMGIKDFTLKNYTNRKNEQINFSSSLQAPVMIQNKTVDFTIKKISDFEFIGEAEFSGQKIIRILKYNKDTAAFTSELNFSAGLESVQYLCL